MELTGKAKEDFEFWLFNRNHPEEYYNRELISKTCLNALIIEWFDSAGIYIYFDTGTYVLKPNFRYKIITEDDTYIGNKEDSRQEATEQSIKKANEIYNENKIIKES